MVGGQGKAIGFDDTGKDLHGLEAIHVVLRQMLALLGRIRTMGLGQAFECARTGASTDCLNCTNSVREKTVFIDFCKKQIIPALFRFAYPALGADRKDIASLPVTAPTFARNSQSCTRRANTSFCLPSPFCRLRG
jgi:hypothetical protein